jgi:hypothetical protein
VSEQQLIAAVRDLALLVQILWARYPGFMSPDELGDLMDSLPEDLLHALMASTGHAHKSAAWDNDHPHCVLINSLSTQGDEIAPVDSDAVTLMPAESMALTVALAQVLRGEEPGVNVASVCVLALARIDGRHDWTSMEDGA